MKLLIDKIVKIHVVYNLLYQIYNVSFALNIINMTMIGFYSIMCCYAFFTLRDSLVALDIRTPWNLKATSWQMHCPKSFLKLIMLVDFVLRSFAQRLPCSSCEFYTLVCTRSCRF